MKNVRLLTFFLFLTANLLAQSNDKSYSEKSKFSQHHMQGTIGIGKYLENYVFSGDYIKGSFSGNLRYTYSPHKNFGLGIGWYFDTASFDEEKMRKDSESDVSVGKWKKGSILLEVKYIAKIKDIEVEFFFGLGRGVTVFPNIFFIKYNDFYYKTVKSGIARGGGLNLTHKINEKIGITFNFKLIDQDIGINHKEYKKDENLIHSFETEEPLFLDGSIGLKFFL
jgi:hypothetical protein